MKFTLICGDADHRIWEHVDHEMVPRIGEYVDWPDGEFSYVEYRVIGVCHDFTPDRIEEGIMVGLVAVSTHSWVEDDDEWVREAVPRTRPGLFRAPHGVAPNY